MASFVQQMSQARKISQINLEHYFNNKSIDNISFVFWFRLFITTTWSLQIIAIKTWFCIVFYKLCMLS